MYACRGLGRQAVLEPFASGQLAVIAFAKIGLDGHVRLLLYIPTLLAHVY